MYEKTDIIFLRMCASKISPDSDFNTSFGTLAKKELQT